jgi:hypothetical protein
MVWELDLLLASELVVSNIEYPMAVNDFGLYMSRF